MKTLYSVEEYTLTKWVRYLLTAVLAVLAILVVISFFVDFETPGYHKAPLWAVVVITAILVIFSLLCFFKKVKVEVDASEIRVRIFRTKVYRKKDIVSSVIKEIDPIRDYGGWGYRMKKGERAIVISGTNKGVYLKFKEDPNLFISSNEPERFLRAVKGQN